MNESTEHLKVTCGTHSGGKEKTFVFCERSMGIINILLPIVSLLWQRCRSDYLHAMALREMRLYCSAINICFTLAPIVPCEGT